MYRLITLCMALLVYAGAAFADDTAPADKVPPKETAKQADSSASGKDPGHKDGPVKMSGMSILGNEEAPKSLVIVPWKSSQLGDMPGIARLLDSSTQPVDKDVFMRELAYYEIRSKAQ